MLVLAIDNFLEMTTNEGYKSKWGKIKNELAQNIRSTCGQGETEIHTTHLSERISVPQNFDENQIYYHGGTAVAFLPDCFQKRKSNRPTAACLRM